jgi:hypothetical protein
MKRNSSKYQVVVMGKTSTKQQFYCDGTAIPITENFELLGMDRTGPKVRITLIYVWRKGP